MASLRTTRDRTCSVLLLILAAFTVGCGPSYDLAPVTGVVTIDGTPYPGGKVVFAPIAKGSSDIAGRASFGVPDQQGRFELSCFKANDGAVVGEHTVTFFRAADDSASRPDLKGFSFRRISLPSGPVTVREEENVIDVSFTLDEVRKYGNRL